MGNALGVLSYAGTAIATLPVNLAGNGTLIIQTATLKFKEASIDAIRGLFTAVLESTPKVVHQLSPRLLLTTADNLVRAVVNALTSQVGSLPIIKKDLASNEINKATISLLWRDSAELGRFLVGLLDPIKRYALANSDTGIAEPNEEHGTNNELDLTDPMNRHAVICQFQRLVRSVVLILSHMTRNPSQGIDITHETTLLSDQTNTTITVPSSTPSGWAIKHKEKWIFVNGIAGELYWLKTACIKIATKYEREVTGVFNRGDGILWDLLECAGERRLHGSERAASQRQLIKRTASSRNAQEALKKELEEALRLAEEETKIVVIAHSQGCLLLQLSLEDILVGRTALLSDSTPTSQETYASARKKMRKHLYVFTFGNPSVDWRLETSDQDCISQSSYDDFRGEEDIAHLSSYVHCTEHFANEKDFVAKLGVLNPNRGANSGYSNIFINNRPTWIGHLFGTQYSLNKDHYQPNSQTSRLLECLPGQSISD